MTDPQTTQTVGEQLRRAREARHISLEQAATQTHIRLRYVQALEMDEVTAFPSKAQARGFLRAYADYLGLGPAGLVTTWGDEPPSEPVKPRKGERPPPPAGMTEPLGGAAQSGEATSIFTEIGLRLRTQRELLGLSVGDVERHTHLRQHYLQALEMGNLQGLPSPVQGKGMLKNYADFLGLDGERLLLDYADGLQAGLSARRQTDTSVTHKPATRRVARPRLLSLDMLLAVILGIFLLTFIAWGGVRILDVRAAQTPGVTAPSIGEVLSSTEQPLTPTAAESPTPGVNGTPLANPFPATNEQISPTPEVLPTPSNAAVQVYIVAEQRAWLRVTVDDKLAFEGRVAPGNAYSYAGNDRIELLTGNGAAIKVFNGPTDLGILGGFGEVVMRIFTVSGVQTPTPTITPTPQPITPTPAGSTTPTAPPPP
jgi:cytoskeleton protein RodZ